METENEKGLSVSDYVELITDSLGNGQRKQAREQLARALADGCTAKAIADELHILIGWPFTITFLASYIDEKEGRS